MEIKEGFNNKKTTIIINGNTNGTIELWIKQLGLPDEFKVTLGYMTLQEASDLKKECETALRDALGI